MPTPLQILLDPVSLTVLALYGALIGLEALFPARRLPAVPGWRTRALLVFAVYFFLSSYLPLLWSETLAKYQLLNLESINPAVYFFLSSYLPLLWSETLDRKSVV